uniref:Uncharacterized protein n=1 Tax=Arundo donax TaxID=35708 RepID=A0A0A9DQL4_ARUDO
MPPPMWNSVQVLKVIFKWAPPATNRFIWKINFRLISRISKVPWMTAGSSTMTVVCPLLVDHVRCMFSTLVFTFVLLSLRFYEPFPSFIPIHISIPQISPM